MTSLSKKKNGGCLTAGLSHNTNRRAYVYNIGYSSDN